MEQRITLVEEPDDRLARQPDVTSSIASIEDIETQIRRAEKMGEALDKLRSLAVKRTVPSDWISMGGNVYLEGDGALRIAPMIGLRLANVRRESQIVEGGTVRVTVTADASSALFGTTFPGISRTRTSVDAFLTQNGKKQRADLEDVEAAAYKGMVARAVQLICGLSGLTQGELKSRFGLDFSGSAVTFKGGQSEAKREDAANAAPGLIEVNRILLKLSEGDAAKASDILFKITDGNGFTGKRDPAKLTANQVVWVTKRLQAQEAAYDKERGAAREPGEDG